MHVVNLEEFIINLSHSSEDVTVHYRPQENQIKITGICYSKKSKQEIIKKCKDFRPLFMNEQNPHYSIIWRMIR